MRQADFHKICCSSSPISPQKAFRFFFSQMCFYFKCIPDGEETRKNPISIISFCVGLLISWHALTLPQHGTETMSYWGAIKARRNARTCKRISPRKFDLMDGRTINTPGYKRPAHSEIVLFMFPIYLFLSTHQLWTMCSSLQPPGQTNSLKLGRQHSCLPLFATFLNISWSRKNKLKWKPMTRWNKLKCNSFQKWYRNEVHKICLGSRPRHEISM